MNIGNKQGTLDNAGMMKPPKANEKMSKHIGKKSLQLQKLTNKHLSAS